MKHIFKLPDHEKKEVIGIIRGHRQRKDKYKSYEGYYSLFDLNEIRKIRAVEKALTEATEGIEEAEKIKEHLILHIENRHKYPYIRLDTKLTESQYFKTMYKFLFLVCEELKK